MKQTLVEKQPAQAVSAKSKVEWAELKFPPLNLWNIWPTKEMAAIHAESQDHTLWETY